MDSQLIKIQTMLRQAQGFDFGTTDKSDKIISRIQKLFASSRAEFAKSIAEVMRERGTLARKARDNLPGQTLQAIIVKPLGDTCDLRCSYCYEGYQGQRYNNKTMDVGLLEKVIHDAIEQAEGGLSFLWHGGEPTLAGIDFFQMAIHFQKIHNTNNIPIRNALQTHGLAINSEWIDFLRENDFTIGVSVDGTRDLHDKNRKNIRGEGTFDSACQSIRLLTAAGLSVGVITVVSDSFEGREQEILDTYGSLGIASADFHPQYGNYPFYRDPVTPVIFARFMTNLFDRWVDHPTSFSILTFDECLRFLAGIGPRVCYFSGRCSTVVAVEGDGSVVSCTRPFRRDHYTFGNVNGNNLSHITASEPFTRFKREDERAIARTSDCRWHKMCGNGCAQHRTTNSIPEVSGSNLYCRCSSGEEGGYATLWEHITHHLIENFPTFQNARTDNS